MHIDLRRKADLFDFHNALIFLGFLLFFSLLKAELAIVHDLADGGIGLGGDVHQVESLFFGGIQRLLKGHDPQLLALAVDQPDFLFPDFLVDLMFHDANVKAPP